MSAGTTRSGVRRAWLCDFDGTIAPDDIGAALVARYSVATAGERAALLARWRAGALGHRALTEAECRGLRVDEAEARAFTLGFALDPHVAGFARDAAARGDALMVVSEGFDFYVEPQLARAGLAHLPWAANHARFEEGRVIPDFPHPGGCGECGNCKAQHVRAWRERGYEVAIVGNGHSDRCGAAAADVVLARGGLLDWCRDRGIAATPFADFAEVAAFARAPRGARFDAGAGSGAR